MRKNFIAVFLWVFLFSSLHAQNCGIPSQVNVTPTSHRSMHVSWSLPDANGSRLVLHRQEQIVNHPGEGWQGADLSVLYGGQTSLGVQASTPGYAMADDIRLTRQAQLTKMDFYVYAENVPVTASPVTGAYVYIYAERPTDTTTQPVWQSATVLPATCTWTTAYRVQANGAYTPNHYLDTIRPIFKITVDVNALLDPGDYWIAVNMVTPSAQPVFGVPLVDDQHVTTGNAYRITPQTGVWQPWTDSTSLEQMGMPLAVYGYFTDDNITGFQVYRDGLLLNNQPLGTMDYEDADTLLQPDQTYCYQVQTVCVQGTSALSAAVCGTTLPDPCILTTLPYQENFDAYRDTFPDCWRRHKFPVNGNILPVVTTITSVSSPVLKLSAVTNGYGLAVTPKINDTLLDLQQIVVQCDVYKTSAAAALVVGVMTDPDDPYTFVPVDTVSPSAVNQYEKVFVGLHLYMGNGSYIALKALDGTVYVEDFSLQPMACMHPASLYMAQIGSDFVKIAWDAFPGTAPFTVHYKQSGQSQWTEETSVYDNYLVISGLNPEENYSFEVRVKSACGSRFLAGSFAITTTCQSASLPFMENFDFYELDNTVLNPMPTCWLRYNTSSAEPYPYVEARIPGARYRSLAFLAEAYQKVVAVMPTIDDMPISQLTLNLSAWKTTGSENIGRLMVGVVSNTADILGSFVVVDSVDLSDHAAEYQISLSSYGGNGNRIALMAKAPNDFIHTYNEFYVDDIVVSSPNPCHPPVQIWQTNTTSQSITCTWKPAPSSSPTGYTLAYRHEDDFNWVEIPNITDTFHTINGLWSDAVYEVRVCSQCTPVIRSNFSFPVSCRTLCQVPVSAPYRTRFDQEATGSVPSCWMVPDVDIQPQVTKNPTIYYSPLQCLDIQTDTTWVATPAFNDPIQTLAVSFYAYRNGTNQCGRLQVFVCDNPFDESTYEYVGDAVPTTTNTWEFFEFYLDTLHNIGPGKRVMFRLQTPQRAGYHYYIDDLEITTIPLCARPVQVEAVNVTDSSAWIRWVADPASTTANIRYKTIYEDDWHTIFGVAPDSCLIQPLVVSSPYQVQVQTLCLNNETSPWSDILSFTTQCGEIKTLPYQENFDYNGVGYNTHPNCWKHGFSHPNITPQYPYIHNLYSYSEPGAYYFKGTGTQCTYAALPTISSTIPISQLRVSFLLYASSPYKFEIGFMEDADDVTTFQPWDTMQVVQSEWTEYDVDFTGYTGSGRNIAFKSGQTLLGYIYLDNVIVDYQPTCHRPTNVVVTQLGSDYMELHWKRGGNETQWEVAYKADTSLAWSSILVTDTFCTLTNLSPFTVYTYKIRSICSSSDKSRYTSMATQLTLCEDISSLPYLENFDTYGVADNNSGDYVTPPCWNIQTRYNSSHVSSAQNITGDSYYLYDGIGSLFLYNQNTSYTTLALPALDASIDMQYVKVSFKIRMYYMTQIQVGVMTNPLDPSTFTPINYTLTFEWGSWYHAEAFLSDYQGTGRYIAFRSNTGTSESYGYLDNILIDYTDCPAPNFAMVSQITQTSAYVSWPTDLMASSWEYVYGPAGFNPDTATVHESYDNYVTLNNLIPGTRYAFYVRNICNGTAYSSWSAASVFNTKCLDAHIPYQEFFDDYGTSIASSDNVFPPCWTKKGNGASAISNLSHQPYFSGPGALFLSNDAGQYEYVSTPLLQDTLSKLQVHFLGKFDNLNRSIDVGVMTNPTDTSTFTLIETIHARTQVWNEYTIPLTSYTGTGQYLSFRSQGSVPTVFYIDNLSVDYAPVCVHPVNVSVSNIGIHSVEVNWTPGREETEWQVVIGPAGFNPETAGAGTLVTAYNHPITINSLADATFYDVYVRAACENQSYSDWSSAISFRTQCFPINSLPYNESFDSLGSANYTFPLCWEKNSTSMFTSSIWYPYTVTTPHYNGSRSLFFHANNNYCIATLPPVGDAISLDTVQLRFHWNVSLSSSVLHVGLMTNPYDTSTFEEIQAVTRVAGGWNEVIIPFDTYTGTGRYIAFKAQGGSNVNINVDDVNLERIPTCLIPQDLQVLAVMADAVQLQWTDTLNSNNYWQIAYGLRGVDPDGNATLVLTDTLPLTITGLQEGMDYEFYVRAYCTPDDQSDWLGPVSARTLCVTAKSLPYIDNFDSYEGASQQATGQMPPCWLAYRTSTSIPMPHIVQYGYNYTSPNGVMMFAHGIGYYSYLVLPEMSDTLYNLKISFWKRMYQQNSHLEIGYMTDNTDTSTFVTIEQISSETDINGAYDTIHFYRYANVPVAGYIAFRYKTAYTGQDYCGLDNVKVQRDEVDCPTPSQLVVSDIDTRHAIVRWQPGGDEDLWYVFLWSEDPALPAMIDVTVPEVEFNDLEPNTGYHVQVKARCYLQWESEFSDAVFFQTLAEDTVGIEEYGMAVSLYPNPTTGHLTIQDSQEPIHRILIYDIYGNILYINNVNDNQVEMDVSRLATGMYMIRIETEKGTIVRRFVKR
ncbi:MAG: fibronectin type III domain-containing protein [Bacteroidales bacterium]|nr:fibronectin type III domain-containing protein [Bacteroidales bacterium]